MPWIYAVIFSFNAISRKIKMCGRDIQIITSHFQEVWYVHCDKDIPIRGFHITVTTKPDIDGVNYMSYKLCSCGNSISAYNYIKPKKWMCKVNVRKPIEKQIVRTTFNLRPHPAAMHKTWRNGSTSTLKDLNFLKHSSFLDIREYQKRIEALINSFSIAIVKSSSPGADAGG